MSTFLTFFNWQRRLSYVTYINIISLCMLEFKVYRKTARSFSLSETFTSKSQALRTSSHSWPRSQKALACHIVCPFVLLSPGLLSYWPDLGWGFFDESLNRTKLEGGVKEIIQFSATMSPLQCSMTTILYHILTVKSVSTSSNCGQLLKVTLRHNIKEHSESIFKLPWKHNRARNWGGMCIC